MLPMQGSWGAFILIVGVVTMVAGGIRGVMSGNLKTTLAYSSMSQIGFILTGVGMQSLLAEYLMAADAAGVEGEAASAIIEVFGMASTAHACIC